MVGISKSAMAAECYSLVTDFLTRGAPAGKAWASSIQTSAEVFWSEVGNGLPESAQDFLAFGRAKYYDGPAFADDVLLSFAGNILKTS